LAKEVGRVPAHQRLVLDDQYCLPNCVGFGASSIIHTNGYAKIVKWFRLKSKIVLLNLRPKPYMRLA
jgi:hypothetical protein